MTSTHRVAAIVSGLCLLVSPALAGATEKPAVVDARRLSAADKEPGNWMSHGRTYGEQRFSPLTRVNDRNIDQLGLAFHEFIRPTGRCIALLTEKCELAGFCVDDAELVAVLVLGHLQTRAADQHRALGQHHLAGKYADLLGIVVTQRVGLDIHRLFAIGTFGHGFTYTAHPVGCAVALKTIEIYQRDRIVEHVRKVAPVFQARLDKLAEHPLVGEARGVGLIGGLDPAPAAPPSKAALRDLPLVRERLRQRDPTAVDPLFVGLLNPNSQGGVIMNSAPLAGYADVAADKPTPVPIEAGRDWRRLLGWGCGTLLVALGAVAIVAPSALSPDTGREATPFLEFRVVVAHGSPSTLVARSGSSITLRPDGHPAVLLSPILQDEYVLLEVRQSTDSVLARKDVGPLLLRAHLKPGVQVRMDRPFRLTVEWTGRRAAASK